MDDTEAEQRRWDAALDCCYECGTKPSKSKKKKLLRCSRCRALCYCSVECQKKAYKKWHKSECKSIAAEKEAAGTSWSITANQVPRLPVEHPNSSNPTAAGAVLAREVLASGKMPSQVEPFNPNLTAWMEHICCLSRTELRNISDILMGVGGTDVETSTDKVVLRTLFLLGCSSSGQPTVEELLALTLGSQTIAKLRLTGHTCHRLVLDNDRDEQIFCTNDRDPQLNVPGALGMLMMMGTMNNNPNTGNTSGGNSSFYSLMERYMFAGQNGQPLNPDVVENDLHRVFAAANIRNSSLPISVDARMHATSFLLLMDAGIPPPLQNVRHTPHEIWEEAS